MPIETDLNTDPFWDDFDEEKNFHQILFRPRFAVQTREVNQLQTILQNQIERFGENIFKEGTIIKGCPLTFDSAYSYVKVRDLQVDGQPLNPSAFANTLIRSTANLEAIVVNTEDGLESQNPNLNTLFIKYQNTGTAGELEFAPEDVLSAFDRNRSVQRVVVANSGTGYSNSDTVTFTSTTGSGAAAVIVTDNDGAIVRVVVSDGGENYLSDPTASIANTSGTGAVLTAETTIAQISIVANSFANASNTQWDPVGAGYAVRVGDGIVFQKGYFVRVEPQEVVVSKYTTAPDSLVVGFTTVESIVNNSIDTSLNDNSQGSTNFNAPGAYRLKLEPQLTVLDLDDASSTNNFFSIVEFDEGRPVKIRQTTQYNVIGQEMARRTAEESGDYVVNPFGVVLDDISANTTHIQAKVGAGLGYVSGYRVEQSDASSVAIRKGTDTAEKRSIDLTVSLGNYVYVYSYQGTFLFNQAAQVDLYSGLSTGISSGSGTQLGQARVRAVVFDHGIPGDSAAVYRVYLFDVQMNPGQNFSDVRSLFYNGSNKGAANILLDAYGDAVIQEPGIRSYLYPVGNRATKTLRTAGAVNETNYIYTTVDTATSFAANGTLSKTLVGDTFPYSGTLDSISERDFIFTAQATVAVAANATGNVAISNSNTSVIGTGTTFLSYYDIGDSIQTGSGENRRIISIANNTFLSVNAAFAAANTDTTHKRVYVAGDAINFTTKTGRTISVSGSSLTASLGETLSGSLAVTSVYNVQRSTAVALTKAINKDSYVKIQPNANNLSGPWCLGVPDVMGLVTVTKTSNSDYITSATDVTSHFVLDNGQNDTHYGLAYLRKRPNSTLSLANTDYILVKLDTFTYTSTGGGIGFFSVDSYPVDDATEPTPSNKIRTEEIPVYKSQTGNAYDLRDCVDFRPVAANTANVTANASLATVNPSNTVSFAAAEKNFPAPNKNFETSLQYYLGRYDKITINSQGTIAVLEGPVTDVPKPPADLAGAMTIATVSVPPYPTLSQKEAREVNRQDYATSATLNMQKRFTMRDIGKIEKRVENLEYYTALSLLEKQTKDLVIPSAADPTLEAFKNGIFVDPFTDFRLANVIDGEFSASIDTVNNELRPRFDQSKFDLKVSSLSGTQIANDIITLSANGVAFIQQPYASITRTCSDQHWTFTGNIDVYPEFFNYYDIRYNPYVELGLGGSVSAVSNNVFYNSQSGSVTVNPAAGSINIYSDQNFANQVRQHIPAPTTGNTTTSFSRSVPQNWTTIGDFLNIDSSGTQFVYEHTVIFKATGLKPNTTYFTKFDGVDTTYWTVGLTQALYERNIVQRYNFIRAGFGGPNALKLISDSTGTLYGALFIPRGYFYVGARLFEVMDNLAAPTSYASIVYHAYDYNPDAQNPAILSTRMAAYAQTIPSASKTFTTPNLPTSPFTISTSNTGYTSTGILSFDVTPSPLFQTFHVSSQDTNGQEGLYVSAVDLFFKTKDTRFGVSVELRTVENGVPTSTIIPMSHSHLPSANVNVSNTSATATTFNFKSPIFLRAGYTYALAIKADGNSPDYEVWVARAGDSDRLQPSIKCRQDWGEGQLFTSTNDKSLITVANEDIKFNLYRVSYSEVSGTATLTNRDDEYFTVANVVGTFMHGEPVFVFSNTHMLAGNVSFDANTLTLTGVGTSFLSLLANGSMVHVANTVTPTTASDFSTLLVTSVANNTSLTLLDKPAWSGTTVKAYFAPSGVSTYYNSANGILHLTGSTAANSTFKFANGDVIIGTLTGAYGTVETVDNLAIHEFEPIIYRTVVTGTTVTATAQLSNTSLGLTSARVVKFNDTNYVTDVDAVVASKSNEIVAGSGKSFRITLTLTSEDAMISPTVDMQSASIVRYENLINNDDTNEHTSLGSATSKYVSTNVVLEDGQDAEQLRVYLAGYKPAGTDIQVYARLLNALDSDNLNNKSWTKLELVGADRNSKLTERNDFYEYQYALANTTATTTISGVVATTNASATVSGSNTLFESALANNDVIKITDTVNDRYFITKVSGAPASNTSLTITTVAPWTSTGATLEKLTDAHSVWLNPENDDVAEYYGASSAFSGFKVFAIKIVLLSDAARIAPRAKAPRALAITT